MTLVTVQRLECQGKAGGCTASLTASGYTPTAVRKIARRAGWRTAGRGEGSKDTCPECSGPPPKGTCEICRDQAKSDFRDAIGHDRTGHLVANLLASRGITTGKQVLALTHEQMQAIPKLGATGYMCLLQLQHALRTQGRRKR